MSSVGLAVVHLSALAMGLWLHSCGCGSTLEYVETQVGQCCQRQGNGG